MDFRYLKLDAFAFLLSLFIHIFIFVFVQVSSALVVRKYVVVDLKSLPVDLEIRLNVLSTTGSWGNNKLLNSGSFPCLRSGAISVVSARNAYSALPLSGDGVESVGKGGFVLAVSRPSVTRSSLYRGMSRIKSDISGDAIDGKEDSEKILYSRMEKEIAGYIIGIKKRIDAFWNPPYSCRGCSMVVTLGIKRDGAIERLLIENASSSGEFNTSVIDAVYDAAPFSPAPESMGDFLLRVYFETR